MNEDIKKELEDFGYPETKSIARKRDLRELKSKVLERTQFLNQTMRTERLSMRIYCIINDITEVPKCPECEKEVKINQNTDVSGMYDTYTFSTFCSRSCMRKSDLTVEKRQKTIHERYDGKHNMQSEKGQQEYKDAILKKYGVDNPNKVDAVREKIKSTVEERYGDKHYYKTGDFKKKQKIAWEKYGGHPMYSNEVKAKIRQNNKEKYGVDNPAQSHIEERSLEILNDKERLQALYSEIGYLEDIATHLGVSFSAVQRACSSLNVNINKRHMVSRGEKELCEFLSEHNIDFETNTRKVIDGELDIYIPNHNLAIEFNGIYWHSDKFRHKDFHQKKSLECMNEGILLIHIWEDQWKDEHKKTIIKEKILSKIGILGKRVFARNTSVQEVPPKEARLFMDKTHIQGKTTASKWIGLYLGDELVCCMGVKEITPKHFDIVRFSSSYTVIGGFSKCLKYFTNNHEWDSIISYAALDYSHGNVYESTGFNFVKVTVPGMWYVRGDQRFRRETFMKHKLNDIFDNFDENLTEYENMKENGFLRLFDSGSLKYEIKNAP